jgi:hypothetical protein
MKYIKKISLLFLLTLLGGFVLSSCKVDEPTVITPKTSDQYIKEFTQFVTSESATVRNCKVGYDKGNFTPVSTTSFASYKAAYLTALIADSAVIAKPNVTIAELVIANTSLAVPGKAFWGKINISDRRPLNDLIATATTLNNNAVVGSLTGNVSQAAKTAFTSAITTATTTRDALTTIDRQVTDGITALNVSIKAFTDAIIK